MYWGRDGEWASALGLTITVHKWAYDTQVTNPNTKQGGSLYYFNDGLWYIPVGLQTHHMRVGHTNHEAILTWSWYILEERYTLIIRSLR